MESSKIECTGNAQCNLLSVTENNEENTDSVLTFQFLSQFFLICVSDKIGKEFIARQIPILYSRLDQSKFFIVCTPLGGFTPLLVMTVTETESDGISKILQLSPEQKVKRNIEWGQLFW